MDVHNLSRIALGSAKTFYEFRMMVSANTKVIPERFNSTNDTRQKLHLGSFLLSRNGVDALLEVEDCEEASKCKPHARVGKVSTRTYSVWESDQQDELKNLVSVFVTFFQSHIRWTLSHLC